MGGFTEGQFVRVLHTDYKDEFPVGSVFKVGESYSHGVEPEGEHASLFFLNHELEPWQPRVGERVRVINSVVVTHWNEFWAKENGVKLSLGDFVYVTNFIPDYLRGTSAVEITARQNGSGPRWLLDKFEPILTTTTPEQPATFKIEEGKFYKTRDGRKIGPMVVAQGRGKPWPWKSRYGLNIYYFKENGFSCPGSAHLHRDTDDIVAEWIDEPVTESSTTTAGNDNTQPKFKASDRVKCLKSYPGQFTDGKEYVVSADHFGREYESVKVKVDDAGSTENGWLPEFFELVTPTTTIVALIENGQPKPSSTPHVHASTGAAEKEAKRLAAKFKGQQFGVFTLTTTHHEPKPVYDHKWQNMAALGLKIDAIRELRSITGMGLKPAKDAVEYFLAAA